MRFRSPPARSSNRVCASIGSILQMPASSGWNSGSIFASVRER